jgi:hypothetical protein
MQQQLQQLPMQQLSLLTHAVAFQVAFATSARGRRALPEKRETKRVKKRNTKLTTENTFGMYLCLVDRSSVACTSYSGVEDPLPDTGVSRELLSDTHRITMKLFR